MMGSAFLRPLGLKQGTKAEKILSKDDLLIGDVPINIDHLFIKVDRKLVKIAFNNLDYLEGFGEYVKVHTTNKMLLTLRTMTSFMEVLPKLSFYRIHRSYIINLNKIEIIEEGSVKIGDKWIPISRKLKEDFLDLMKKRGVL